MQRAQQERVQHGTYVTRLYHRYGSRAAVHNTHANIEGVSGTADSKTSIIRPKYLLGYTVHTTRCQTNQNTAFSLLPQQSALLCVHIVTVAKCVLYITMIHHDHIY